MTGTKERALVPLPHDVSLNNLVLSIHFYRRLEEAVDLSFVRELVRPLYAKGGKPSVDLVVCFFVLAALVLLTGCDLRHRNAMKAFILLVVGLQSLLIFDESGEVDNGRQ